LRWVFTYRTAHRGFVFAASGTTGVARRRSALSARSELWSFQSPLFQRGVKPIRAAFLTVFHPLDYAKSQKNRPPLARRDVDMQFHAVR
jgi:hypothetical protein